MLGQPASSQTVCKPSRRTKPFSSVNSGPIRARVLIHDGFFSIGVSLLRTSSRSSLRPSGAIVTAPAYDPDDREGPPRQLPGRPSTSCDVLLLRAVGQLEGPLTHALVDLRRP